MSDPLREEPGPGRHRRHRRHHCHQCLHEVEELLEDIDDKLGQLVCNTDRRPARIRLLAHSIEGTSIMADTPQFPVGHPVKITAEVFNAEGVPVPDSLTYTTTSGTLTVEDSTTLTATLTGAELGTVSVSASDGSGVTGTLDIQIVDATPASITLSAALA